MLKKPDPHYIWLAILAFFYLLLTFITPPNGASLTKYSLSPTQARLISLSVVAPILLIWLVAFYGFIRFKNYAESIKDTKDGVQLLGVARGLMYLAFTLPVTSVASSAANYISAMRHDLTPKTVIFNNYIAIILLLMAFYVIYKGAMGLFSTLKKRPSLHSPRDILALLVFISLSVFFIYSTLTSTNRQFPISPTTKATYYLPDWLLIISILIPYVMMWYFGISAAYYIQLYRKKVSGIIYKKSLGYLSGGIVTVIASFIFIRFLNSWASHLGTLSLKILLLVLYILVLNIAIGFVLIAVGANKLKKIEEV